MFKKFNEWFNTLQTSKKQIYLFLMFCSWYGSLLLAETLVKNWQIENLFTFSLQIFGTIGFLSTMLMIGLKLNQMPANKKFQ